MVLSVDVLGKVTNAAKFREASGSISETTMRGGVGEYIFSWADSPTTTVAVRSALKAGIYKLTVTDSGNSTSRPVVINFVVRQPRESASTNKNTRTPLSTWAKGRNFYYIDDAPAAVITPPPTQAGDYAVTTEGITAAGGNSLSVVNGAWTANTLGAQTLKVGAAGLEQVQLSDTGIDISDDASIYFGGATWRIRFEPNNTELVFEHLETDGLWSRRFILD